MAEIIDYLGPTGLAVYAKPEPLVESPWPDDALTLTEARSGSGWYRATIADPVERYVLFARAGGTPAPTDQVIGLAPVLTPVRALTTDGSEIATETTAASAAASAASADIKLNTLTLSRGPGAWTITITVDDGIYPIEGATVRMTKGVESYVGSTDADGTMVFNLDDGLWAVAITKSGYQFAGASLGVAGDDEQTYNMAQVVITPPTTPGQTTGYLVVYDADGAVAASVPITVKLVRRLSPSNGASLTTEERTEQSNAQGLVQFVGLWASAQYQAKRQNGPWLDFRTGTSPTTALPEVLGRP